MASPLRLITVLILGIGWMALTAGCGSGSIPAHKPSAEQTAKAVKLGEQMKAAKEKKKR